MTAQTIVDSPTIGINDIQLKLRLVRLAEIDDRKVSAIARRLLTPAVEAEENRLGLGPINEDPDYKAAS